MRIVLMLGLSFGLRLHDAVCFQWSCIKGDAVEFKPAKTKRRSKEMLCLPIPSILQQQFELAKTWKRNEYVLPQMAHRYQTNSSGISQDISKLLRASGIETLEAADSSIRRQKYRNSSGEICTRHIGRYSYHSFRHTFCTMAANAGQDLSIIRSMVGHANIQMTEHYTHYSLDSKRQVIESLPLPTAKKLMLEEGANIYELSQYDKNSEGIDAYKDRFIIKSIDGRDNSIEFLNGIKLYAGNTYGVENTDIQVRRLQIRETIITHLERERQLFHRGIKVLSLFFIDEVAKYKVYENSVAMNGVYADIFEEEYAAIVQNYLDEISFDEAFQSYLRSISASATHAGYFSIDKKSKQMIDGKIDKKENRSDDTDAYDLIMKNKERLLDRNEPVRFIFSHSALREGWDNPNVFQICTLKQSSAEVSKRQEVGRGLRLCVNQFGERQDASVLGGDVQTINILTVIANESYDSFAKALQSDYANAVADRPRQITEALFINKVVHNARGEEAMLTADDASEIIFSMAANQYIDIRKKTLTDKFYDDKAAGKLVLPESMESFRDDILKIIDSIYDPAKLAPEDASKNNVTLRIDENKLKRKEFQELWKQINTKTAYIVDFDTDELIRKAIQQINTELRVSRIFAVKESGEMRTIQSKEALLEGKAFSKTKRDDDEDLNAAASSKVKYDLIGKIVTETGLTRDAVAKILKGINADKFAMFERNPEEFIIKTSTLINEQKATVIVQHITYNKLTETHNTDIFTEPNMKGQLGVNAMVSPKHLYDYLIFDSKASEQKFAEELEAASEVILYVKLPRGFYINTPVGKYNPDWAIAFDSAKVKHVYFVAETKGDLSTLQLRKIESAKIQCARKHFAAISTESVVYDHVSCYEDLLAIVK